MKQGKGWRIVLWAAAVLLLAAAFSLHFAAKVLRTQIEDALGESSQVGDLSLGLFSVTISDLRIKAPPGWPVEDNFNAKRIVIAPDWLALLSNRVAVRYIHADGVYQSVLRDGSGKLRLLPALLDHRRKGDDTSPPEVSIGELKLSNASLDFYDATIRKPPYRVHLENVELNVGRIHLPDLAGRSPLALKGMIRGPHGDGSYALDGEIELSSRDSVLTTTMRNVDLTTLKPYLVRAADTGVKRGELDLDLTSTVQKRHLDARGILTLHDLVLDDEGSIMGLPRQATVNMLKNERQDIRVNFTLQGNLDDPRFSINESLATRFSAGLAEALGVSISSLGRTVGNAASGIGGAIRELFK